jgi:hypothetical protein
VRPDPSLHIQQGQQALTDHAGGIEREADHKADRGATPTTVPATAPSSP